MYGSTIVYKVYGSTLNPASRLVTVNHKPDLSSRAVLYIDRRL